ncbi:MAG: DUF6175 family protein [Mediterranea sp.]|jgi:hypothetical protein|nr:DUF6175 family protein [Mediterranea sp.]
MRVNRLTGAALALLAVLPVFAQQLPNISVVVVPFKLSSESYLQVMENNSDRRMAVNAVHEGFVSYGISTIDVLAKAKLTQRGAEYEANAADSGDRQLLLNSGADVYVEVDMSRQRGNDGTTSVLLSLKAYETATAAVLASTTATTPAFRTTQYDKLCILAAKKALPGFMTAISEALLKKGEVGQSVALRITIADGSMMNMNTAVAGEGSFSSQVRKWVRANSHEGKYHLQGLVGETMVFDNIHMPPKAADGFPMDAAIYMDDFVMFLKEELGIDIQDTDYKLDGNTIYITIP